MHTTPGEESSSAPGTQAGRPKGVFVTTHWSVVLTAGRKDTARAASALAALCATYWYPLYSYVRRRGYGPEDAQDLTQEFFARLLEKQWLNQADRERGRFRTFLLSAMSHFLANAWDKASARKRGGGLPVVPIQLDTAETRYGREPADASTPDRAYERRWAVTLLDRVLARLQEEYTAAGKAKLFEHLKPSLLGEGNSQPYAVLALKLGLSEGAIKVAVHRFRKRYRELLRDEIAQTVGTAAEVEEEMRHLFNVLAG